MILPFGPEPAMPSRGKSFCAAILRANGLANNRVGLSDCAFIGATTGLELDGGVFSSTTSCTSSVIGAFACLSSKVIDATSSPSSASIAITLLTATF